MGAVRFVKNKFARFAELTSRATGSFWAFTVAVLAVAGWALSGPLFHYSDHWQMIINTATTIITFLMVFLIQHTQNRDIRAVHLKLNELIASSDGASNRLIEIEGLTDEELEVLNARFLVLAKQAAKIKPATKTTVEAYPDKSASKKK